MELEEAVSEHFLHHSRFIDWTEVEKQESGDFVTRLPFFCNSKLYAEPEEDKAMELGVAYGTGDEFRDVLSFDNK